MNLVSAILVGVLLAAVPYSVLGHPTPCNQGNFSMCVDGVQDYFTRRDWFFGDGYEERCPNGPSNGDFYCRNPDTTRRTIQSRFLKTDNFDVSQITQYLSMRWDTPAGYYKACGHYFNVEPFAMYRDLDSTHTIYYDRWILNHRPAISFTSVPGEVYTLMAYDAGYLRLSGLWVNIRAGDTSTGREVYPHQHPFGAMWEIRAPQVYALFRQPNGQEIEDIEDMREQIEQYIHNNNGEYDASTFISAHQLEGPIAIGFLVIKTDAFAIQAMIDRGIFDNCPYLFSRNRELMMALDVIGMTFNSNNYFRDYRGPFLRNLEMRMDITYRSPEAHFDSCCQHFMFPAQEWTLDSLSDEPVNSVMLRYQPTVKLSPVEMQMSDFGLGRKYILVLLDITEASTNETNSNTTVEWMRVNVPGDNSGEGEDVVNYPYRPPMVKKRGEKRMYAFLLLRQHYDINPRYMWTYTNPRYCAGDDANRCHFDFGEMERLLQATVASVSVFYVEQDDYTRAVMYGEVPYNYGYTLSRPRMSKYQVCQDIEGYAEPCPRKGCDWDHQPPHGNNSTYQPPNNSSSADYNY